MHFRDIQLPDSSTLPRSATLISGNSTKGARSTTNSEGEVQAGNTGTHTAKDVGIGAGIGTVAGLIFPLSPAGLVLQYVVGTAGAPLVAGWSAWLVWQLPRRNPWPSPWPIAAFAAQPRRAQLPPAALAALTDREREVMTLVAAGLSNDEIAEMQPGLQAKLLRVLEKEADDMTRINHIHKSSVK